LQTIIAVDLARSLGQQLFVLPSLYHFDKAGDLIKSCLVQKYGLPGTLSQVLWLMTRDGHMIL